jgi:DNA-binding response OmpR family regulator
MFKKKDKKNILIVDDTIDNVTLLENYLKSIKNIKIYKSYNPLDSIKTLKKIKLSLILLDIQMDDINGYELATKIKIGEYGNKNINTPIVFITAIYGNDIDKLKGYNIGSIDYIIKPICSDIIDKIKKYLNNDNNISQIKMTNLKKSINI